MKLIYLILTSALVASTSYAMDKAAPSKHKAEKQPHALAVKTSALQVTHPKRKAKKQHIPSALGVKDTTPKVIHISSFNIPIRFNGKTKTLYEWLQSHPENKFNNTPIMTLSFTHGASVEKMNIVRTINEKELREMACQDAFYISNMSKQYITDKKFIRYGAIILNPYLTDTNQELNDKVMIKAANYAQAFSIAMNHKAAQSAQDESSSNE